MDLSEIPHEQWDYTILQLTSESDCSYSSESFELAKGEIQEFKPIYENDIPETERLLFNPQFQSGTNADGLWYNNGCNMEGRIDQLELVPESSVPLVLEYHPELSEAQQGFETPSIRSEFLLEMPPMEESFGDNMLALTSFDPDHNTEGVSVISHFTDPSPTVSFDPYPESLNRWLRQFTTDGSEIYSDEMYGIAGMSDCGPGPSASNYQSNTSEWGPVLSEENELSGLSVNTWVPPLALTDGCDLAEAESVWPATGEERENVGVHEERESVLKMRKRGRGLERESGKRGRARREETRDERESERACRLVIREERETEKRKSNRASKPPARYIDEWSRPEKRRKTAGRGRPASKNPKIESKIYLTPRVVPVPVFGTFKSCKC